MTETRRADSLVSVFSEQKALVGIFIATLLGLLSVGSLLPVLPLYVTEELGFGDVTVGFVIGAYALTGIAFRPIAGWLADHSGRRLIVIVGSLAAATAGALLFLPIGLGGLIASRLLLGAGEGAVFTAGSAWVVDMAPIARRARVIGIYGLAVWTGLTIGPAIGDALFRASGYGLVWGFAAAGPILGAIVASRLPDRYVPHRGSGPKQSLIAREALGPGAALALASCGYAAIASFIVLHLQSQGEGHGAIVFSTFAAALVITRLIAGGLPDRFGPRHVASIAAILEAVGLTLIGLAESMPVDIAGAVIMGTAYSVLYPSLSLIVVERVPPSRRGAALGTFTGAFDLGVGLGAPLVGFAVSLGDYSTGFFFAAILAVVPALAHWINLMRSRPGVS